MSLTAKQEKFAQAIADGKSQADAYRLAYSASKQTEATVWANASRVASDSKVLARVNELKSALADKALWTREQSVNRLVAVFNMSDKASDHVAAVKELNAMHGFNAPQKHEHEVKGGLTFTRIELVPLK